MMRITSPVTNYSWYTTPAVRAWLHNNLALQTYVHYMIRSIHLTMFVRIKSKKLILIYRTNIADSDLDTFTRSSRQTINTNIKASERGVVVLKESSAAAQGAIHRTTRHRVGKFSQRKTGVGTDHSPRSTNKQKKVRPIHVAVKTCPIHTVGVPI